VIITFSELPCTN